MRKKDFLMVLSLILDDCLIHNSFGVIIKGAASVHAREDHGGAPQQDTVSIPRGQRERVAMVGHELRHISAGGSFGERAMLCEHPPYNVML